MVSLVKGQKVSLTKDSPDLKQLLVGLGWDVNNSNNKLFGGNYDLDAAAIVLRDGKYIQKSDLIYFGHLNGLDGAIKHCGDNLTGEGDGDDEQIIIKLNELPSDVDRVVIVVNIYQAKHRKQDFGKVQNAFIRLADGKSGTELYRFNLTEDYSGAIGMIFGEIYRHGNEWKFNPVGAGVKEQSLAEIARTYA